MARAVNYIVNPEASIVGVRGFTLPTEGVERAIHRTRDLIGRLASFEIDVFTLLGMRNLSAFVGEVFAAAMVIEHSSIFQKNPHQDGYPDLLLLDADGRRAWEQLSGQVRDKRPFSPFVTGGFEVKATCGAVPTPAECRRRGFEKPDLGDQRIAVATGYDWKAHHRETNRLFGLYWDFIDRCPAIVAVFYSGSLTEDDWGRIVQPTEGGGRTTSVSIMNREGVRKMYEGWIAVIDSDEQYASFFDRRNGGDSMRSALAGRG